MRDQDLLAIDDPPPYSVLNPDGTSPYLLICEHASNRIPHALGDLGLPESERRRHIAWDIGASALAQHLSQSLDAPLFLANYSRLVIDCNRPPHALSAIPEISEATKIPGNLKLSGAEKARRIETLFTPFTDAILRRLDRLQLEGQPVLIVGIHSFTPVYLGQRRPWQVGVLYGKAARFGQALIRTLRADTSLTIGDNEPYTIHPAEDYTVPVYADDRGLPGALIEVRHDLIDAPVGVDRWADRLTSCLQTVLESFCSR